MPVKATVLNTNDQPRPMFSAVIPVYRGRATVNELCQRLAEFFRARGSTYEIILVDDDSSDGSWGQIKELTEQSPQVMGIRLMRNFGQHNATNCGLAIARGEWMVTLDEDLQHPPEEIGKLIECQQQQDADVVYGLPIERKHPWWRRIGSRLAMLVPRYVMKIKFDISSFRLIRRSVAEVVSTAIRHDIFIDVYVSWTTNRIAAIHVRHEAARPSGYGPIKLIALMVHMLCSYTVLPLRMSASLGAILSAVTFLLAAYFAVMKMLQGINVPGFTAIIVAILFSTGVLLLSVGAASEYLARVFLHVNRKPQWVIREATDEGRLNSDL